MYDNIDIVNCCTCVTTFYCIYNLLLSSINCILMCYVPYYIAYYCIVICYIPFYCVVHSCYFVCIYKLIIFVIKRVLFR
jgi:hypothetical protein